MESHSIRLKVIRREGSEHADAHIKTSNVSTMSKLPFVLLLLHNLLLLVPSHADEFSVAAYYAGAGYQPDYNVNASAHLLTDLILASQEPQEDATLNGCCLKPLDYATARQARTYKEEKTGRTT
jgi:hypothetical protein